ncbi:MAG: hypothetical protein K2J47_07415, partial [Ruminococcus sp.]|nr:hypothetical protein [Ruminococcus sp.]
MKKQNSYNLNDSILSIGTKHGCLTILDMGEEYAQLEPYLSSADEEEKESLIKENLLYDSIANARIKFKLGTHYKCKCKCGKIHYYDATTIKSNPKYCFYPVPISTRFTYSVKANNATYHKKQKYAYLENVILCDKSECMPSNDYCDYYNTYRTKQLAKKEEKLRLEIGKFREKIDNLPRVKAENYDIDFVGKYYESLYIEKCCDDYLENKPMPYYSYPSSMDYSKKLKLKSEFEILRNIITAEDFTTDKQLFPIMQNLKFDRVH